MRTFVVLSIFVLFASICAIKGEVTLQSGKELITQVEELIKKIRDGIAEKTKDNAKFDWAETMKQRANGLENLADGFNRQLTKTTENQRVSPRLLQSSYDNLMTTYQRQLKEYDDVFVKGKELRRRSSKNHTKENRA